MVGYSKFFMEEDLAFVVLLKIDQFNPFLITYNIIKLMMRKCIMKWIKMILGQQIDIKRWNSVVFHYYSASRYELC